MDTGAPRDEESRNGSAEAPIGLPEGISLTDEEAQRETPPPDRGDRPLIEDWFSLSPRYSRHPLMDLFLSWANRPFGARPRDEEAPRGTQDGGSA